MHHFGNLDYNGTNDPDGDGLTNLQEFIYHTDPMDFGNSATNAFQDSDGNGLPDWWEILNFGVLGNDPNQTVAANGGLTLQQIYDNDLELGVSATLGDGVPDAWKIANGLSTTDPDVANEDPDTDGLTNSEEYDAGTNPHNAYSDSDTIVDGRDLYPLVADPTTPTSFYVAVPSWEEQSNSPDPDWSAVDHTTVELRWEASSNNPANYVIERRADNDLWQAIATVSGGETTYEDDGLVANRHYQYRIRATRTEGETQVSSAFATANYRVPLNLRLHAKTASSSQSKWNYGIGEFTTPSTPPKYYLTKTDISSYTQSSSSSGYSSSGSGSYSRTRTADPMLKKVEETGSHSTESQQNWWWEGGSSSSTSSSSSDYSSLDQARSPGVPTATTQRSVSSESDSSSSSSSGSSSSSSSSSEGSYLLQGTYSPTDGPALWAGSDFDMSRGTVSFAGSSSSSSSYTSSGGSNSNSSASASASGTGSPTWAGTSTNSSGQSSSISWPPSSGYWYQNGWFSGLQSTTPTSKTYSYTSGSTQYQGTQTLSGEYSTEALIATTIAHMSDYPPEWTEDYWGWGYYDWGYWGPYDYWGYDNWYYNYGYGYYWWGWGTAQWNLSTDEAQLSTSKFKYKFSANPSAPTTMRWAEIFVPYDDYNTPDVNESLDIEVVTERTWQLTGSENESPEFEIDPTQNPSSRNGYYTILIRPVSISVPGLGEAGKDKTGQDTEPGKVVLINDGDADNDGIPDYADGYNLHSAIETDNACEGASFIPLHVGFYAIDPQNAKVKFTYAASNPTAITTTSTNPFQLPANGKIRLWLKDANGGWDYDPATGNSEFAQRDGRTITQGGHFIESGVEYTLEDLGIDPDYYYYDYGAGFTVYAELVKTSSAVADIPVKVEIKPNANLGFVFSDQVRFTGVALTVTSENYEDTHRTSVSGIIPSSVASLAERYTANGVTPGSFLRYWIEIKDPRASIGNITVGTSELPLIGGNGIHTSPPFIFSHSSQVPPDIGVTYTLPFARSPVEMSYNPARTLVDGTQVKRSYMDLDDLAHFQEEAERIVTEGGFSGTPSQRGTAIADKTWELMQAAGKTKQWAYSVRVDDITGKIVSIGGNPVLSHNTVPTLDDTTEIDFVRMKRGNKFKIGDVWDHSKTVRIHEMKNSITGSLSADQFERLRLMVDGDLDKFFVSWGKYEVTTSGREIARRFTLRKYGFRVVGGAALVALVLTAPAALTEESERMVDLTEQLYEVRGNPGATFLYRTDLELSMRNVAEIISPEASAVLRIPLDVKFVEDLTEIILQQ
jgi:hypothetical protein